MDKGDAVWIIGALFSVVSGFFWHDRNKQEKDNLDNKNKLELVTKEVHQLSTRQAQYTTHSDVRDLIRESIDPLHATQRETMGLVKDINSTLNTLSRDLAVINALREREATRGKSNVE